MRAVTHRIGASALTITILCSLQASAAVAGSSEAAGVAAAKQEDSGVHDFDFLQGHWSVQHRRLKHRLAHSNEWEAFSGTLESRSILAGQANVDENVIEAPTGTYRAATMRVFDPSTRTWAIWWFDARQPHQLDPPVIGAFKDGVGTFLSQDEFQGRPIKVHFIWSQITKTTARWEQAFSEDGGVTWETNWVMEFKRTR